MHNDLSRVIEAVPGLIWSARPDGDIDFVNAWWRRYTGLRNEDAYGQGWYVAIHPDDRPGLSERWRAVRAAEASGEMDARLRGADGTFRWFRFRVDSLRHASGEIVGWSGIGIERDDAQPVLESQDECWWLSPSGRENHFRWIVDGLPVMVALMTPAGDLELANRQAKDYFGAVLEGLHGWADVMALQHPHDRPALVTAWTRSDRTGKAVDCEGRQRRADGEYRWFHIRRTPLRDRDGRIVFWHLQQTDIDDRKRAEALLLGEKQLLEMVAGGDPMTQILDVLCRLVERAAGGCHCSVVLVDSTGMRLEHGAAPSLPASFITSIIGRPVNAESGPCAMAAYLNEQVIASDLTSETRWAAHEWCPMALSHGLYACWSTPIASADGTALGAFAIYYEEPRAPTPLERSLIAQLTHIASIAIERAQAHAALKRSAAFLAEAQHVSQTGSFSWRVPTHAITWSAESYRIFGFEPGPVTLEMIRSRVHRDDLPLFVDMLQRASDGSDFEYEHRLQMPDQSVKYLQLVAHGVRDLDGQLEYTGVVQDVTRRRMAEEALGRARTELAHVARVTTLGTLTASITHEVSQPVLGIITNCNTCLRMLAADPPDVDGAREVVRRTLRDGNRASDIITRLRALFANKGVAMKSLDLNEATREVIALSLSELQRSRVVMHVDLADDLPSVTGDRVQLQQVILNLLLNAADAMRDIEDRPREVVIKTERHDEEQVRLSVQDAGVGVVHEDLPRMFEAFYTTKRDGMGIGLSVSRSIIQSHQGRLSGTPNAGHGATFSFSIPYRAEIEPGVSSQCGP